MRKLIRVVILTLSFVLITSLHADWPSTKFKILQETPSVRFSGDYFKHLFKAQKQDVKEKFAPVKEELITELENYLHDVAIKYSVKYGFKAPALKLDDSNSYNIYMYNYIKTKEDEKIMPQALYINGCYGSEKVIIMERSKVLDEVNISPKMFEDLAHELFHAIQGSYPLFNGNCDLGDWIYEGTATAIGEDIAIQLGKLKKIKNWGQRTYSNTLWVPDLHGEVKELYSEQEGHRTSGFWRYIGEYISSGGNAGTKQVKPPSYNYLTKLFKINIKGKTNDINELKWIDKFLKSNNSGVGRGLGDIYPLFISTFAHYVPDRDTPAIGGIKKWHKCLFVSGLDCRYPSGGNAKDIGCERVDLSKNSKEHVTSATSFQKVSARCFEVFYSGPADKLDVQIYIESDDKEIINSIRTIGFQTNPLDGSKKIIKVLESTTADFDNYPSTGLWEFQSVGFRRPKIMQKSVVFVVSNVARISSQTYEGSEKVKFNFSYELSTGTVQTSN